MSLSTLAALPPTVARPAYEVRDAQVGVVHLGVGNFHRAHQAVFLDDALAAGERGWAIAGVSLRSAATRDALAPQDGLYALLERSGRADAPVMRVRVVGALRRLMVAPESPQRVIDAIAAPATRWVTATITEKGYGVDAASGELDASSPDIAHDLGAGGAPRSAIGMLARALDARRRARLPGVAVVSCDNLAGNGRIVERALHAFVERAAGRDGWPDAREARSLAQWMRDAVAFPSTMVDRIVPHTTDATRAWARTALGMHDAWPVATEPFTQWVIEARFGAVPRPALERSGVQLVPDVADWEAMKLRVLNAAHSAIAYLGLLAGADTVDAAIAVPAVRGFVERYWRDEAVPALPAAMREQAAPYGHRLLERFANAALAHRTRQIAMDGSHKLPMRVLPTLRENLAAGRGIDGAATIVAAWMRCLAGCDEAGRPLPVDDPLASRLCALADRTQPASVRVGALLSLREVFGELGEARAVRAAVCAALERIEARGAIAALG